MKDFVLTITILSVFFATCKNTDKREISPYDKLIRNPMTAGKEVDTVQIPKLFIPEPIFEFGDVREGDSVEHVFHLYNKGLTELLITNISSSCGCTVPNLYKRNLTSGDSTELRVVFHSKGKEGQQDKKITIFANTFPPETDIFVRGNVKP